MLTSTELANAIIGWARPTNPEEAILSKADTYWHENGEENLGSGCTLSTGCLPIVRDLRTQMGREFSREHNAWGFEAEAQCECKGFLDIKKMY